MVAPGCINYQNPSHLIEDCPPPVDTAAALQEQINAVFQRARNDPYSQTYNAGWKNHPNFAWGNQQNQYPGAPVVPQQKQNMGGYPNQYNQVYANPLPAAPMGPPPGFGGEQEKRLGALEKSLTTMQLQLNQTNNNNQQQFAHTSKMFEAIMSKIDGLEKGKFPSQPVPNPKEQGPNQSQVNAVHVLRSGKEVDNHVQKPEEETPSSSPPTASPIIETSQDKEAEEDVEPPREVVAPFPNRLKPKKNQAQLEKFLELFKQVKVNVPLLDAIEQVPA